MVAAPALSCYFSQVEAMQEKPTHLSRFHAALTFPLGCILGPVSPADCVAVGLGGGRPMSTLGSGGSVKTRWATYSQGDWLSPKLELLPTGVGTLQGVRL